jgi:hypothetical protein
LESTPGLSINANGFPSTTQINADAAYTFTTFAGFAAIGGADGVGSGARFARPNGIAVDSGGNIYVADTEDSTIRKVTAAGVVSTIAGLADNSGSSDGTNNAARFNGPQGVAVDGAGNIYVADTSNNEIRKITPVGTNWVVSTLAGLATAAGGNADGTNSVARFNGPWGVAVDVAGNSVYVTDELNNTIRQLTSSGTNWVVTTIAGSAIFPGSSDGTNDAAGFHFPEGIAMDKVGRLYIADHYNQTIRQIVSIGTNWVVTTLAGTAGNSGFNDGTNGSAQFYYPNGIAIDGAGTLYVISVVTHTVRKIVPVGTNWVVSTFAGFVNKAGSLDGTGTNALFFDPQQVAVNMNGELFVTDSGNNTIRKITSAGVVSTLAGFTGTGKGSMDGTGTEARFNDPVSVAVDHDGSVFVADTLNNTIRMITSAGVVSTLAGSPTNFGSSADGVGDRARFFFPGGITVDGADNIYLADTENHTIRKITAAGVVSTIAGFPGSNGASNGIGSSARFYYPSHVTVDDATNLYVTDSDNHTIRKIAPSGTNWVVSTIAGLAGSRGTNDGANDAARFYNPEGLAIDKNGSIFVADYGNGTIRKLLPEGTNWIVTTIAGVAGSFGSADGVGTNARFLTVTGIAVDREGSLYVTDNGNDTIRKITPAGTNWVVTTIGGKARAMGGSDGAGIAARFDSPADIAVDAVGDLYVADAGNNAIRKAVFSEYGKANPIPYPLPPQNGQLTVTLAPAEAQGQWRFPWELIWRNSGTTANNLVAGNYLIQMRNVSGYVAVPPGDPIPVTNNGMTSVSFQYYPTINPVEINNLVGSLTVNIGPSPPAGVGWRFLGESGAYLYSGFTTNLPAGIYLIEFAPVNGFSKPPNQQVQVKGGAPTTLSESYLLVTTQLPNGVLLPAPVPDNQITDSTNYPFAFNGRLQSDVEVGYGSGVAVLPKVVLTAAHLVFNDQTLSYASQVYWRGQEEAGKFEPQPQLARSYCVLSGYASQRTNDVLGGLGPDQSSPQSRNFDVAALYFPQAVAGGGYGGYLPSDAAPNTWLTGTSLKMLVGYPVDGSQFGKADIVPGLMYQTQPQPYPLSLATESVDNQQVYAAPWFLSYPGNSGGPLYVQLNGYYYPAGVYLGTLYNGTQPYASAVRAINSEVVSLITNAAALGDSGTNSTGGGVVLLTPGASSLFQLGYFSIRVTPSNAADKGAAWRISELTDSAYYSNSAVFGLPVGHYTVSYRPLAAFLTPTNYPFELTDNVTNVIEARYTSLQPTASSLRVTGGTVSLLFTNAPLGQSYAIERSTNLVNWFPLATNQTATNGTLSVTNSGMNNIPNAFYRARLVP